MSRAEARQTAASSSSVRPASGGERPSQATASSSSPARASAARGWRSAVMSESNWCAPALKPSGSSRAVVDDLAVVDEQRAGLQQVAARAGGERRAAQAHRAAVDVHARALRVPRRVEGDVAAGDAADAQLSERLGRRAW